MSGKPVTGERRKHERKPGRGAVVATAMDDMAHDGRPLQDLEVLNVSPGGIALLTSDTVAPGTRIHLSTVTDARFKSPVTACTVEVLDRTDWQDNRNLLRCRLVAGHLAAAMIYG